MNILFNFYTLLYTNKFSKTNNQSACTAGIRTCMQCIIEPSKEYMHAMKFARKLQCGPHVNTQIIHEITAIGMKIIF